MAEFIKDLPRIHGIFDTHSHYDDGRFDEMRDALLNYLFENGLDGIITCGCDIPSSKKAIELASNYNKMYAAVGFHPTNIPEFEPDLQELRELLKHEKVVALGEIGLDYHWDTPKDLQKKWFLAQLDLATKLDIPVILHDREAHGDMFDVISNYHIKGVMHCYSGSSEMAKQLVDMGLYIGVGGVVTFKNGRKLQEVVAMLPRERILLETDCPYLAPEPFRSKTCHSGLIAFTAKKIAEIRNESVEEVISYTNENAKRLFNIK